MNPLASGVIGTPGCFISPGHCESSLNSTAPEQRAVGRPGMDPKGFENHGITGRDDLYPLAGLGSNPPPTPAGGLHGQTPGTDFQEPPDGLLHAGLHRPCGWQTGSIRKPFYDRRGRSSSMTHFMETDSKDHRYSYSLSLCVKTNDSYHYYIQHDQKTV